MVDYAFSIETQGGIVLRIASTFIYKSAAGQIHQLDPAGEPAFLGPSFSIARSAVVVGVASSSGTLRLEFADGSALDVPADGLYEAWTIAGPDGLLLVSTPGGGLATWGLHTP